MSEAITRPGRPSTRSLAGPPPGRGIGAARDRRRPRGHRRARHPGAAARSRARPAPVPAAAQRAAVRALPLRREGTVARRGHRGSRRCRLRLRRGDRRGAGPPERHGVDAGRIIHTHPVKKAAEIAEAIEAGVRTFVVDNELELEKFAGAPADVGLLVRLGYRSPHAKSDLSSKFGVGAVRGGASRRARR